ncbi:endonuclease III domain-containing protein [Minwuia sp.]|uniref:endonuclease III domain-containing protein n=1 Tax=Minwuia sp. TaxID=2493630 RepID=UPI003A8ED329
MVVKSVPMLTDDEIDELLRRLADRFPGRSDRAKGAKRQPNPFRSVVSCMLSAQSLDRNTARATQALFKLARTPKTILKLDDEVIAAAIRPAGLYNVKTRNLKNMCRTLLSEFDGNVPRTREGLMRLPGVGRKCADIVLSFAFDEDVIAVDTHIHRVCNRTGLARGKTEEQTARSLESRAPEWSRRDGHFWLLNFGKQVCRARNPGCPTCPVNDICMVFRTASDG